MEVFSVKEAAKLLKCSEWTIREMCKHGELKYFRVGNNIRIRDTEIERYIRQSEQVNHANRF